MCKVTKRSYTFIAALWLTSILIIGLLSSATLAKQANTTQANQEHANQEEVSKRRAITISKGSLAAALSVVATVYNTSIIADAEFIKPFDTQAIQGNFTLNDIVQRLIAKHAISATFTSAGIVLRAQFTQDTELPNDPDTVSKHNIEDLVVIGAKLSSFSNNNGLGLKNSAADQTQYRQSSADFLSTVNYVGLRALPSQSLAEAFGHLSGLTLGRDFGEGLSISAKGLGPAYQSTLLNGHPLAVNENVRDSGQSGRTFRFDVLPAQNIERIDIIKNPNAAIAEAGIGATISLKSLRPLSIGTKQRKLSVGSNYSRHSNSSAVNASLLNNWVNADEKLGLLLSLSTDGKIIRQDHFHTWDWEPNGNSYTLPIASSRSTPNTLLIPSNRIAVTVESERRRRNNITVSAQWQPVPTILFSIEQLYSSLDVQYDEQRWLARLDNPNTLLQAVSVENSSLVAAQFEGVSAKAARDSSDQEHINSTSLFSVEITQALWDIDLSFAHTRALSQTVSPIRRTRFKIPPTPFQFSVAGGKKATPKFTFSPFPTIGDTAVVEHASARHIKTTDSGNSLRASFKRGLTLPLLSGIKMGVDWREQARAYHRQDTRVAKETLSNTLLQDRFIDNIKITNFLAGNLANSLPVIWQIPSNEIHNIFSKELVFGSPNQQDKARSYSINERVLGVFFAADIALDIGIPIIGESALRWQQWSNIVGGFYAGSDVSVPIFNQLNETHSDWLGSIQLRSQLNEQWMIKAAIGKAIALPNYADLQPGLLLNSTDGVWLASEGNPSLQPVSSVQVDVGMLWSTSNTQTYFGGFARDINHYIDIFAQQIHIGDQPYQLSRPENTQAFQVSGWEVDIQHALHRNIGIQFNAISLNNSHSSRRLESVVDWNYKVQAYYESDKLAVRIALDHQSDYLSINSATAVPDTRIASQRYLSASINYALSKQFSVTVSGQNLLAEPVVYYFQHDGGETLKEIEYIGRSYALHVNFSF